MQSDLGTPPETIRCRRELRTKADRRPLEDGDAFATVAMMDAKSQQVANEVVEAGIEALRTTHVPTWNALNVAFLGLGDGLAEATIGTFARGLESVQVDTAEAIALREKVAIDLHRKAVAIVTAGAEMAEIALRLSDTPEADARAATSWRLRSGIAEDSVPGDSEEELMATAHRNYVLAAAELYGLNEKATSPEEIERFAHEVLDNVVSFAVSAAAIARAVESPAV